MSNLPQTIHEIRFINHGQNHSPSWFVETTYTDKMGKKHTDFFKVHGDSSAILEYIYIDDLGTPIPKRIVIED